MHRDIISKLLSAGPSDIHHQHNEPEPLTKDVWLVLYCNSRLCFIAVYLAIKIFLLELPILSRGPTHFVNVYPDMVIQHNVSTQADMFLACSSPKQPCTPVMEDDSTVSFTDDTYINVI